MFRKSYTNTIFVASFSCFALPYCALTYNQLFSVLFDCLVSGSKLKVICVPYVHLRNSLIVFKEESKLNKNIEIKRLFSV